MKARILLIAAALLAAMATASPAQPTVGLVGHWQLDEGQGTEVGDGSGHGNNGTLTGGVSWVAGRFGSALSFNGASGNVQVPDSASLEPATAVSVAAWVKHAGSPGDFKYVLAKGASGCIAASYGLYTGANGGLEFYISRNRGTAYALSPDAGARVWDGNWHLAVGTFDGTTIRLYVDGVEVGSGTTYPGPLQYPLSTSNDLFIGDYPGCQAHTFLGDIDEVSVWNGALPASAIEQMAQGDLTPSPTGPSGAGQGSAGGSGASGGQGQGSSQPTTSNANPPIVRLLRITPSRFTDAAIAAAGRATGPTISYIDGHALELTFTLLLRQSGTRQGGRCVKPNHRHGRARAEACTRYSALATFRHRDRAGLNRFRLAVLLRGRRLAPGSYLLSATPSGRNTSGHALDVTFQIVP